MNEEQQNRCVALLLAIAFDGRAETNKADLQRVVKTFLGELPGAVIVRAAGTAISFNPSGVDPQRLAAAVDPNLNP